MNYKNKGFTIVELLIVVVVIAILAAITIVSYRGIQKRASTSVYISAADSVEKKIRLAAIGGSLNSRLSPGEFTCVGQISDFPATSDFAEGECIKQIYSSDGHVRSYSVNSVWSANFNAAGIKSPVLPIVRKTTPDYEGGSILTLGRGILLVMFSGNYAEIQYTPPDSSACGRGENYGYLEASYDVAGYCYHRFNM